MQEGKHTIVALTCTYTTICDGVLTQTPGHVVASALAHAQAFSCAVLLLHQLMLQTWLTSLLDTTASLELLLI